MNPVHLLVITNPDDPMIDNVIHEALYTAHAGLPSHMLQGVIDSAYLFTRSGRHIRDYWFLCLIAVQARPAGEPVETTLLRKELESIFYELIYGD